MPSSSRVLDKAAVTCRMLSRPCGAAAIATLLIVAVTASDQTSDDLDPPTSEIAEWIRALGADEFATREAAQRNLIEAGLDVYDRVQHATTSSDREVRGRAGFILEQLRRQVAWIPPNASPRVRSILQSYERTSVLGRELRVIILSDVAEDGGAQPLCQIAKYDSSERVAKVAALTLIEAFWQGSLAQEDALRDDLLRILEGVERPSATWLRGCLIYLRDRQWDASVVARWLESERQLLVEKSPDTDFDLAFRLATSLVPPSDERPGPAVVEAVKQLIEIDDEFTEERLIHVVDWLLLQGEYESAVELLKQHSGILQNGVNLTCRLADAQWHAGDHPSATETAAKTKARDQQSLESHLNVARYYARRGHRDWANAEYQLLMDSAGDKSSLSIWARSLRSELLHDQGQEASAAEMLLPAVEWIDQDKDLREQLDRDGLRTASHIKSRWHFFSSLHHHQQEDLQSERQSLIEAIKNNPLDADVIIAMYRFPDEDETWQKQVRARIDQARNQFEAEIKQGRKELRHLETSLSRATVEPANIQRARLDLYRRARQILATYNNQLAWLVSNTEGDFDEALRLSQESVRLAPQDAGLLDTLGRCYFATGDLENAIKCQKQAVALEPHSGQILKQLELFQEAAAE